MIRVKKINSKNTISTDWMYVSMNLDKVIVSVDPETDDYFISPKFDAVITRAKSKGKFYRPPMEIESPVTGLHSTLIWPQQRNIADHDAGVKLFRTIARLPRGQLFTYASRYRSMLPLMGKDEPAPLEMPPEIETFVDGINNVFDGYHVNHVTVHWGAIQLSHEPAISVCDDKFESMCYTFYLVMYGAGSAAIFNVPGIKDWPMPTGSMMVWSPHDNIATPRALTTVGDVAIIGFRCAMKYFIDDKGERFMWKPDGSFDKIN